MLSTDAWPSRWKGIQQTSSFTIQLCLLTVQNHPHTLDKIVDDLESLSCGSLSLVMCESVQPLKDSLDVVLSETSLYEFDCLALSKMSNKREGTHLIVLA
jgi:hypothetical protein